MDLHRVYGVKSNLNELDSAGMGLSPNTVLIIKLPDSRAFRIMISSLFLAMVFLMLVSVRSIVGGERRASDVIHESDTDTEFEVGGLKMVLPSLFRDLVEEGLVKKGHKGLVVSSSIHDLVKDFDFLNQNGIDIVIESDINKKMAVNEAFDFVFISSFKDGKAIDSVVKTGGIVISSLSNNSSNKLQQPANYRIMYLRRFEHVMIAMRKIGLTHGRGILCRIAPEAKKAALKGLEDALLEPPRRALAKSRNGSRKIRFLPDLLKDSLENYPRHIFISDGKNGVLEWFHKNYPVRNQEFEIYNIEIEMYDAEISQKLEASNTVVSNWLRNNVKEEDYVVMKAEAVMVEEMIRDKSICLVDELFLECKNEWEDGEDENSSKRAYWQCLALYGRLRDEGVAVHQWWS